MIRFVLISLTLLGSLSFLACRSQQSPQKTPQTASTIEGLPAKKSIAAKLKEQNYLPVEIRIATYYRLKAEQAQAYNFENEDEMTMYGYSLLWEDKLNEALEIFKLIVAEFPDSSNPYDSLGEAYLALGNKDSALYHYQKSLALNPHNFNAEDQIERIKYPDKRVLLPSEKFAKRYTPQQYKEDLNQLGKRLIEVNPSALKFISKQDFWQLIESKKALITATTTYSEFAWHCSEIIASINCSHTSMGRFYHENELLPVSRRFPLKVRLIKDQLFIAEAPSLETPFQQKDEILSINGISTTTIIEQAFSHISTQGFVESSKSHYFNSWANIMIPFALNFPEAYTIQVKGKEGEISLRPPKDLKVPVLSKAFSNCRKDLCLEFVGGANHTAVLTISSFNYYRWNNYEEFTAFIDQSFAEIKEKGIKHLIIDLRFNGGGSPESSIYLLQRLVKEPFIYFIESGYDTGFDTIQAAEETFAGDLYFLIDGQGNSTTGHFMAVAQELKLGSIIGEELGSNQFCTAGQTVCRLPNTKLVYYVANTVSRVYVSKAKDEQGILPDYYVSQNIDDYLNHKDVLKAFALALIEEKSQ
ncbi:MAG: S41 family peptidase [Bacteroidota bacterium]